MLYFSLYTKQKIELPNIFFTANIQCYQKGSSTVQKKQVFDKLLTVLLLLMLPFSETAVRRCPTKYMFLKILQKHKQFFVPESLFQKSYRPPERNSSKSVFQ